MCFLFVVFFVVVVVVVVVVVFTFSFLFYVICVDLFGKCSNLYLFTDLFFSDFPQSQKNPKRGRKLEHCPTPSHPPHFIDIDTSQDFIITVCILKEL